MICDRYLTGEERANRSEIIATQQSLIAQQECLAKQLAENAKQYRDRPLSPNLDLVIFAERTENWNGADLAFLSNRAAIFAIRRHQRDDSSLLENLKITMEDFELAFAEIIEQSTNYRV